VSWPRLSPDNVLVFQGSTPFTAVRLKFLSFFRFFFRLAAAASNHGTLCCCCRCVPFLCIPFFLPPDVAAFFSCWFCTVFFFFDEIFPFFVLIVVWSILVLDRFAFFVTLSPSLTGSFFFGQRRFYAIGFYWVLLGFKVPRQGCGALFTGLSWPPPPPPSK